MIDLDDLKSQAAGRWPELLTRIAGVPSEILDGKGHPCPKCGGLDRFSAFNDFAATGGVMCRKCHNQKNGDGIAAIGWMLGIEFLETVNKIASELGMNGDGPVTVDPTQAMAWQKSITTDSLVAYGAANDVRESMPVCRVPMHDADMQVVGYLDLAQSGKFSKGKMTPGCKHGLFVSEPPKSDDTVCIVEGVKDAAALHNMGISAVGLPTCRMAAEFARFFRGVHVVIIPDRDKAGIDGGEETAARLFMVAESVKVAELPADYSETGGADVRDVLATRDGEKKVRDAIENAKPWGNVGGKKCDIVITHMIDAITGYVDRIGKDDLLLRTGLPYLDDSIGGVAKGEMVVVAARPGHGKTMVGLQILDNMALEVPVLIISEEMIAKLLGKRMMQGITSIKQESWDFHRDKIKSEATHHLDARHPYLIAEQCGTVSRVMQAIDKAIVDYNIGAVAVDYLQLLRGDEKTRYEQVSEASIALKQSAVKHDIIVLALCQLNRGLENRPNSTPKLSDIRDSGQIEQDADIILFVEWLYKTDGERYNETDYKIRVGKIRNRGAKKPNMQCVFMPERQRLYLHAHESHAEFESYGESQQADIWD